MMVIQRIRSGKIVEDCVLIESLGVLQQIGLLLLTQDILDSSGKIIQENT